MAFRNPWGIYILNWWLHFDWHKFKHYQVSKPLWVVKDLWKSVNCDQVLDYSLALQSQSCAQKNMGLKGLFEFISIILWQIKRKSLHEYAST